MKLIININKRSKSHWLLLLLFITIQAKGQNNFIWDGSLENYTICPTLSYHILPPTWYNAGKLDGAGYFNRCSNDNCASVPHNCTGLLSYQETHSGDGYTGIFFFNGNIGNNRRNYVATKLKDSLKQGKCYIATFYVSLENNHKYSCNNISALLSKTQPYVDTLFTPYGVLPANAQIYNYGNPVITDTLNWVKVSSIYVAQGGEQYLTLGNFKYDNQTNFKIIDPNGYSGAGYYIDDVSVIPLDSVPLKADAGKDTSIANVGDSVFIGSLTNGLTGVKWYDANGNEITSKAGVPGFFAKPTASTFYIIEQTVCGYYSRDTVNVTVGTVPLKFISYNLISSLRGTKQSIENTWQTANEINVSHFNILKSNNGVNFKTKGKSKAQNNLINEYSFIDETPNEGLNYYKIESVDFDGRKQYTETRTINYKPQTINSLSIFPNPAKDFVNIVSKENIREIKITNHLGQIIHNAININRTSYKVNLASAAKGIYLLSIINKNGDVVNEKLIVE